MIVLAAVACLVSCSTEPKRMFIIGLLELFAIQELGKTLGRRFYPYASGNHADNQLMIILTIDWLY